ncbi:mitochondrial import inner membrane translocase subunit TIM17-2-like [Triticum urartu]|uniref:mitochondrial import inner membrane translocase subunit TIM17-2-like n=1 Tax=Triticum urartu TaxID=4572 RepID=UPI0020440A75|nr:mitochondrial import inner membrane translocase subunit TIM17-2-like [Triticum urartu]
METATPTTEQTAPRPSIIEKVRRHAIFGGVLGSAVYFSQGATKSPSGSRLFGGALAVPRNVLKIGTFAAWYGAAKSVRCAVAPDYPFETTVAWAATNALFAMRHGRRAACRSGLKGAALGVVADMAQYGVKRFLASRRSRAEERRIARESAACPAGIPADACPAYFVCVLGVLCMLVKL